MRAISLPPTCPVCMDVLSHAVTAADVIGHIERTHGYTRPGAIQLLTGPRERDERHPAAAQGRRV